MKTATQFLLLNVKRRLKCLFFSFLFFIFKAIFILKIKIKKRVILVNILNIYRLHEVMIMSDEYEQFIEGTTIVMEFEYSGEFYAAHIVKSRLPFNHLTVKLPAYDVFLLGRLFDKEARMISLPEHEANYLLQGLVTHPNARLRLKFI